MAKLSLAALLAVVVLAVAVAGGADAEPLRVTRAATVYPVSGNVDSRAATPTSVEVTDDGAGTITIEVRLSNRPSSVGVGDALQVWVDSDSNAATGEPGTQFPRAVGADYVVGSLPKVGSDGTPYQWLGRYVPSTTASSFPSVSSSSLQTSWLPGSVRFRLDRRDLGVTGSFTFWVQTWLVEKDSQGGWRSLAPGNLTQKHRYTLTIPPPPPKPRARSTYWIVSLGDSYTAGDGVPGQHYEANENGCHRSRAAYPWRFAAELVDAGVDAKTYHVACSGSVVRNLTNRYASGGRSMPAQIDEVPANVRAAARIVFVTIGGNDFQFKQVVMGCLLQPFTFGDCISRLDADMDRIFDVVDDTKEALRTAGRKLRNAEIVLVGYPMLTSPRCIQSPFNGTIATLQEALNSAQSAIAAELNREEKTRRFHFVSMRQTFLGHGPCAFSTGDRYVNTTIVSPVWASFHPNARGNDAIAAALLKQFSWTATKR